MSWNQILRPLKDAQLRAVRDRARGLSLAQIAIAHSLPPWEVKGWSRDPRFVRAVEEASACPEECRVALSAELARRQAAHERRAQRRIEARIRRDREALEGMWWRDLVE